ncbi:MAG: hypothetical protein IPK82_38870 [Polyangiaceae bacterium]|nr:hypothetical protein [Polyangiaceae bacterium]
MAKETAKHKWRFYRASGFDQVQLETAADLLALGQLDQKLWTALACPTDSIEVDKKTLELLDADKDGRIRAPEVILAADWMGAILKDASSITKGSQKVQVANIADTVEGKKLAASAKQILKNLGKKDLTEISVDDTTDTAKIFAETKFNGDGVIPVSSAEEADVQAAIKDVIAVSGSVKDRSGEDGIDRKKLDEFFAEAEAYIGWWKTAETGAAEILPLGDKTAAANDTFKAVQAKIEDYFTRTKLAAFDERSVIPLSRDPAEYAALASKLLSEKLDEVAAFPLAKIEPDKPLPLNSGINPAWSAAISKFKAELVTPMMGDKTALTEEEFRTIVGKFAAYEAWLASKAGAKVESLGKDRVRELVEKGYKEKISVLLAKDEALAPEAEVIESVDKLVRLHSDLWKFANNFVTFRDFYLREKATFQAGTLYIDGRTCDLCLFVKDVGAHSGVAIRSGLYLLYCDIERKVDGKKESIVAAVTSGEPDQIIVGRNGVFYDRKGQDWDATITKIVENPISIRQAFWMPYKRVVRLIEEQIEKFASARDKEAEATAASGVGTMGASATAAPGVPAKPPEPPFDIAKYAGIFAAVGLAVGLLGTALAAIFQRIWASPHGKCHSC